MAARPHGRGGRYLTEEEKKNRPKVTKELMQFIGSLMKPYVRHMGLALVCVAGSSILALYPAILTGKIIDRGLIGRDLNILVKLILLSLTVTLLANLIGMMESWLNAWIAQHITRNLRNRMFRHLENMPHQFFISSSQGDIITRMTSDIDGVESIFETTFTSILSNGITLLVAMIAMFRKDALMAVVGMLVIPFFIIPVRKAGKTRWSLMREVQASNDKINGILGETMSVSGQLLVKLFGREDYEYDRYAGENEKMIRLNIRERMAGRWFRMAIGAFSNVGPMLIYLAGGILLIKGNTSLTVGDITVLVALLGKMYGPVNQLLNIQVDWIRSMALFSRIFDYLNMPEVITSPEDAIRPPKASGHVQFSHVNFSYNKGEPILNDVTFSLEPGKSIAIVGPSGAGKSTIASLLPRLYDVDSGMVTFDGHDVRDLDLSWIRSQVGVVTQDTYLFNGTIRDNLRYARENVKEEEMIEACKKANIYDFIQSLPDGFDTLVGNRGLELSGGERQRMSIARVLLKDPVLMIFDEATSSLDSISEASIQKALDPLVREKTSILIAHRLSTILSADRILVVDRGRIVESGTHRDLLEKDGVYAELYRTQFDENRSEAA